MVGGKPASSPPPPAAPPIVKEIPPEPTFKPPVETPPVTPPRTETTTASVTPTASPRIEPKTTAPAPAKPSPIPVPRPAPPVEKPPVVGHLLDAPPTPSVTPKGPSPVPDNGGRIRACLKTASGLPAGAGYTMVFSISGQEKETGSTDASGCASLDFPIDKTAKFFPVRAKERSGAPIEVVQIPPLRIYHGESKPLDVAIKK